MDAVEELAQLHEIGVVLQRSGPPAAVEVGAIGRAADRTEGDPLAADPDVVGGIARMDREFGRRRFQRVLDDLAADPHALAVHAGAGVGQDVARLGMEHVHADLLQHLQRLAVDGLDLIVREDARRFQRELGLRPGQLVDGPVCGTGTAATPLGVHDVSPDKHLRRHGRRGAWRGIHAWPSKSFPQGVKMLS